MIARIIVILEQKLVKKLIVDSGATKTIWVSIIGGEKKRIYTEGTNPALISDEEFSRIIREKLIPALPDEDYDSIYFYGAGCGNEHRANRVSNILRSFFLGDEVHVKTDIEGAGLGLFGLTEGILLISGTGSSAGVMRNGKLVDQMPSDPFPGGDFGSGSHIGGMVLQAYLKGKAPSTFVEIIQTSGGGNKDELLSKLKDQKSAKRIASHTMFIVKELSEHDFLHNIAERSIRLFFEELDGYFSEDLKIFPIKVNGSTAFHFSNIFREIFGEAGIQIDMIQKNPIDELVHFHSHD
ncbi:MAG: hypothetical protein ED557_15485 [Balneola sp.]|nr:MAG: hypothetical protein ED557_15485 [Balneola sp.]